MSRKLPGDYAIDALSIEAVRRGKKMGRPDYSYGKLIADTTKSERDRIVDEYRANYGKRKRQVTRSLFDETDGAGE